MNENIVKTGSDDRRDSAAVALMAASDVRGLELLYQYFRGRLTRFLSRSGCPADAVDDVINETLLTAWQTAERFQRDARVSTWLFGIARNKLLHVFRDRRRHPLPQVLLETDEPTANPDHATQDRQWIELGLAMLPDEQRIVLEMTFIEGMHYREIAEVLAVPEGTIKTRVYHARRKMRQILSDAAEPNGDYRNVTPFPGRSERK